MSRLMRPHGRTLWTILTLAALGVLDDRTNQLLEARVYFANSPPRMQIGYQIKILVTQNI